MVSERDPVAGRGRGSILEEMAFGQWERASLEKMGKNRVGAESRDQSGQQEAARQARLNLGSRGTLVGLNASGGPTTWTSWPWSGIWIRLVQGPVFGGVSVGDWLGNKSGRKPRSSEETCHSGRERWLRAQRRGWVWGMFWKQGQQNLLMDWL